MPPPKKFTGPNRFSLLMEDDDADEIDITGVGPLGIPPINIEGNSTDSFDSTLMGSLSGDVAVLTPQKMG